MLKSLQAKLFITYMLILILLGVGVAIPIYTYLENNIEDNITSNLNEIIKNITGNLEDYSTEFNMISTQFYMSYDNTGHNMIDYLKNLTSSNNELEEFYSRQSIDRFLLLMNSIYQNYYRISVFNESGEQFSTKPVQLTLAQSIQNNNWLSPARNAGGAAVIRFDSNDHWMPSNDVSNVSLTRALDSINQSSYLEVQIEIANIVGLYKISQLTDYNFLIVANNEVVWTSSSAPDQLLANDIGRYQDFIQQSSKQSFVHQTTDRNEHLFIQSSDIMDLSVVLAIPENKLLGPIKLFRNVALLTIFVVLFFSVILFLILSKALTSPLTKLKKVIDSIDLEDNKLEIENKYKMNEIEKINRSFRRMNERLHHSLEETIHFRTMQLQSHFNSLQSQINPHFLFNMLGVIQALSRNKQTEQLTYICSNLADFLRYSIETRSAIVMLDKEAAYTTKYLELMKSRYLHRLHYDIQIDDAIANLLLPKLTLQPLVENCIQHGFPDDDRPLIIKLHATVDSHEWRITICDNGVGWTLDNLNRCKTEIENYIAGLEQEPNTPLTFGGMGLISTMARMKLFAKESFTYELKNNPDHGSSVILIGKIIN
ncbi:sensor histidine kinase [Paenibacillus sinopodophylli]|uniref:sensor histidine kinase n=1 Tax=Paenibacillus sinopodophylli TaxID=1837342 RepID=UPI00110CBF09|nr:histidine kinase [Paenibacillus sinopodophylli]